MRAATAARTVPPSARAVHEVDAEGEVRRAAVRAPARAAVAVAEGQAPALLQAVPPAPRSPAPAATAAPPIPRFVADPLPRVQAALAPSLGPALPTHAITRGVPVGALALRKAASLAPHDVPAAFPAPAETVLELPQGGPPATEARATKRVLALPSACRAALPEAAVGATALARPLPAASAVR